MSHLPVTSAVPATGCAPWFPPFLGSGASNSRPAGPYRPRNPSSTARDLKLTRTTIRLWSQRRLTRRAVWSHRRGLTTRTRCPRYAVHGSERASRATACVPTRCPSRSWVSAPSRSCRRSRASRARRTGSTEGQSPGGASRRRRGRCRIRSRARRAVPRARGRTRASSTRRSRLPRGGVGRVGRARAIR
jgi:hypothetical protein